jgi:hypothetical protein
MKPSDWVDRIGPHSTADAVEPLLDHPDTDESHLLRLLRKRELASSVIEALARHDRWGRRRIVRAAVVNHPKTPRTLALRLLSLLYWKEQLKVATNLRLAMPLRLAAENRLKERLPELETGEKITLARSVPPSLVAVLASEPEARLIQALLQNPRTREVDVVGIVVRESTPAPVLRVVARSERWVSRASVKLGLVRHPNTPVHVSLSLLERIPRRDLKKLVAGKELPRIVALRAERILDGAL